MSEPLQSSQLWDEFTDAWVEKPPDVGRVLRAKDAIEKHFAAEARATAGHRIEGEHDCFALHCKALAQELEQVREWGSELSEARATAQAQVAELRAALARIQDDGCEASRFADEDPPVWDRCIDPNYVEGAPQGRCSPCTAHAALAATPASSRFLDPEATCERLRSAQRVVMARALAALERRHE